VAPLGFISDLHLSVAAPVLLPAFAALLAQLRTRCAALFILGDLFDYWIGDDDLADPFNAAVAQLLRETVDAGLAIKLMHGNRDFLLGARFAAATGVQLVADPLRITSGGRGVLLAHGDALCRADQDYVEFRARVRSTNWRAKFLALSLAERRTEALAMRRQSEVVKRDKAPQLMDVSDDAVAEALRAHDADILIHGHTHRPRRHDLVVGDRPRQRWVLPDWRECGGTPQAGYLELVGAVVSAHPWPMN
jgi:UDP-2,3-diacylglucosamine hydrolase